MLVVYTHIVDKLKYNFKCNQHELMDFSWVFKFTRSARADLGHTNKVCRESALHEVANAKHLCSFFCRAVGEEN